MKGNLCCVQNDSRSIAFLFICLLNATYISACLLFFYQNSPDIDLLQSDAVSTTQEPFFVFALNYCRCSVTVSDAP